MKFIFFCIFLLFSLVESIDAVLWINDFTGQNLGGSWSLTNITTSNTHTAEATAQAGNINTPGGGWYSTSAVTEGNWGSTYNGQYLSLYVWGNGNGTQTLTIEIVEGDYNRTDNSLPAVEQTWSTLSTPLNWTGWRYLMFKLPEGTNGNDFPTVSGADADDPPDWNPTHIDAVVGPPALPEVCGVKQIKFVTNADIYIDEVVISNVGSTDGWVREIFPVMSDSEPDSIDSTLSELPVSISVVLGINASFTNGNNKIVVVEEDPTDNDPSYPTDNLCEAIVGGAPDFGASDGVGGRIVTPSDTESAFDLSSYAFGAPHVYTVFIRPVNGSGEPGKCEVITFTTSAPSSSTTQNLYKRSLIN